VIPVDLQQCVHLHRFGVRLLDAGSIARIVALLVTLIIGLLADNLQLCGGF